MDCEIPNEKRIENIIKNGSPNFTTFPTPVFLVVGSRPGEPPNGRTFYSNPSYYLLDNWAAEEGSDTSRFFRRDFNHFPEMKRLSVLYCKTFDTVIFDFSVLKFLTYSRFIEYFIKLVKPGGVLILDDYYYWKGQQDAVNEFFKGTKYENRIQRFQTQGRRM